MPPFVGLLVEVCWEPAVGFWRYERGDVAGQKVISQPIRIEGPIRQKMSGCQVADQCVGLALVVGLPWHQTEINEISEPVR